MGVLNIYIFLFHAFWWRCTKLNIYLDLISKSKTSPRDWPRLDSYKFTYPSLPSWAIGSYRHGAFFVKVRGSVIKSFHWWLPKFWSLYIRNSRQSCHVQHRCWTLSWFPLSYMNLILEVYEGAKPLPIEVALGFHRPSLLLQNSYFVWNHFLISIKCLKGTIWQDILDIDRKIWKIWQAN